MSKDNKSKFPGCFKYGCFGCLGLFALSVGFVLLIGAIQLATDVEEPNPEQKEATHELPEIPQAYGGQDQPEIPDILPLPEEVVPPDVAPGRLVLDLSLGEFTIRPGPAGEPLRVEADYDSNAFQLSEDFTQDEGGEWTYKVGFGGKGGLLGLLFRGGGEGSRNRVTITIPRGYPLDVVGKIGMGQSEIDLGGLWVRRVDLEMSAGDHFLEFREPLPYPMEELRIDGSMGNLEMRSLGAASPSVVDVKHGMGEILLDLEGDWRGDAEVRTDFSMGGCRVWLPKGVRVEVDRAHVTLGERRIDRSDDSDLPEDAPTIKLRASGSMGELRIEQ